MNFAALIFETVLFILAVIATDSLAVRKANADVDRRNLYLFQFKYSDSYSQFKGSLQRLIEAGMERIFISTNKDDSKNQLLLQLRSCMVENRAIIDQVCFQGT